MKQKIKSKFGVIEDGYIWSVSNLSYIVELLFLTANLFIFFYLIRAILNLSGHVPQPLLLIVLVLVMLNIRIKHPSIRLYKIIGRVKRK